MTEQQRKLRALMMEKGVTIAAVASELGCSCHIVSRTIAGKVRPQRVRDRLIELLGSEAAALLPEPKRRAQQPRTAQRERLRTLMKKNGVTVRGVGEALGLSQDRVYCVLRGRTNGVQARGKRNRARVRDYLIETCGPDAGRLIPANDEGQQVELPVDETLPNVVGDSPFCRRLYALACDEKLGGGDIPSFSKKCGLSVAVMSKFISGKWIPNLNALCAIQNATNVDCNWLLTGKTQGAYEAFAGCSKKLEAAERLLHAMDKENGELVVTIRALLAAGHTIARCADEVTQIYQEQALTIWQYVTAFTHATLDTAARRIEARFDAGPRPADEIPFHWPEDVILARKAWPGSADENR